MSADRRDNEDRELMKALIEQLERVNCNLTEIQDGLGAIVKTANEIERRWMAWRERPVRDGQ